MSGATVTGAQSDPHGGTDALLIADNTTGYGLAAVEPVAYTSGAPVFGSLWVRRDASATATIGIEVDFGGEDYAITVDPVDGRTDTSGGFDSVEIRESISGWWLVSFAHPGVAETGIDIGINVFPAVGLRSAFPAQAGTAVGSATIYGAHVAYETPKPSLVYLHDGSSSGNDFVAVAGHDALSCATRGTIEGVVCAWADTGAAFGTDAAADLETGLTRALTFSEVPTNEPVFILRRKSGAAASVPGSYVVEVGVWSGTAPYTYPFAPAMPELSQEAGEILAPSPSWCAHPQETCAGVDYDGRMPLENELSEDGDAYESSWRYWLTLAQRAAQEADALGQQVIEEGLQNDLRAEAAAARLEELCGGAVDLDGLIQPDLSDARTGGACPSCSDGYICTGGQCIRDPVAVLEDLADADPPNPGAQRLLECLGSDMVIDYVALGRKGICLWRRVGNPNILCEGAFPSQPCPVVVDATSCDGLPAPPPPVEGSNEWVFVEEHLGYFESDAPATGDMLAPPPCAALRIIRDPATAGGPAAALALYPALANGFFEPTRMRELARRIGWEASFGDYSRVTFDGRPWGPTTGGTFTGPPTDSLPCGRGSGTEPLCTYDARNGESLFGCRIANCGSALSRAEFNARLRNAVVAMRRLNMLGFEGIVFPVAGLVPNYGEDLAYTDLWDVDESRSGPVGSVTRRITASGVEIEWATLENYPHSGNRTRTSDGSAVRFPAYCSTALEPTSVDRAWLDITANAAGGLQNDEWYASCTRDVEGCESAPSCFWSTFYLIDGGQMRGGSFDLDGLNVDFWRDLGAVPGFADNSLADILFVSGLRNEPTRRVQPWTDAVRIVDGASYLGDNGGATVGQILDAVELLCEAGEVGGSSCGATPPTVSSVDDINSAVRYLQCGADEIHRSAERVVFANMPRRALDALREQSVVGSYPAVGGDYGVEMTRLRGGLVSLASVPPLISAELRGLATDVDSYRIALAVIDNEREMNELQFASQTAVELTRCLTAALSGNWTNPQSFGTGVVTCANSIVQIMIANRVREIEQENATLQEGSELVEFRDKFFSRLTTIQQLSARIGSELEEIDGSLGRLEQIRTGARGALSQALLLDSDPADVHARVNSAMRGRYDVTLERYERARRDAVRLAFMAKRAIEQRLGMRLSTLRDDMALVEAPARWEARLCELQGVDYQRLRDETDLDVESFADEFIGDYVRRLERVVESYQIDHPFSDGRDTAVISLRDDVQNVRAWCETPTGNLLYEAGQLDSRTNTETGDPVWTIVGCREATGGGVEPNCLSVSGLLPTDRPAAPAGTIEPFPLAHTDLSAVRGFRIAFGHPTGTVCATDGTCGLTTSTALQQEVTLRAGRYRLSWYGATATGESVSPSTAVEVRRGSTGAVAPPATTASSTTAGVNTGWTRYWYIFDAADGETIQIRIVPNTSGGVVSHRVDLAALMLEDVSSEVVNSASGAYVQGSYPPGVFRNTGATLTRLARTCEDTTGQEFRARGWRRNCMRLCAEGFGRSCPEESADTYCYWETNFAITQRDIERGRVFNSAGFARGNYNYRVDNIAVNVVGTGVRDCSLSPTPSSCYSGGFVPFSIEHLGPYTVRNVRGEDYEAPLFTGRIEHGRALASERYLTNPISTADRALIEPYTHGELRGRPIDGSYVLRIWDDPAVRFDRIEDVQIVLGYRYWTRSE